MEDKIISVNIIVPIGKRNVNELRLTLAIFGAIDMTNDNSTVTIHSANNDNIFKIADIFTNVVVIDAN